MTKAELRKFYNTRRLNLSRREKTTFTDLILINFQRLTLPCLEYVHTYLAVYGKNEVDTDPILAYLKFRNPGLQVCVPQINRSTGAMKNYVYNNESEMVINAFGIEEPASGEEVEAVKMDVVLTPLLAFDKEGHRVGFGKGFYDRFFVQCSSHVIKIGLSYFEATDVIDDVDQFDVPLDYCVTPHKIYRF